MNYSEKNKSIFELTTENNSEKVQIDRIKNIGYNSASDRLFIRVYRNLAKPESGCYPFGTSVVSDYSTERLVHRILNKISFESDLEKLAFEKDLTLLVKNIKKEIPTKAKNS